MNGRKLDITELNRLYHADLAIKRESLARALKTAGFSLPVPSLHPTLMEGGYRTRIKLKVFQRDGFIDVRGKDPISGDCAFEEMLWILAPHNRSQVREIVRVLGAISNGPAVDGMEFRGSHGGRTCHVTLSVKRDETSPADKIISDLMEAVPGIAGAAVPSQKTETGNPFLRHNLLDRVFEAHYTAFFQTNRMLLPLLLNQVLALTNGIPRERIVDLYCGAGLYSLSLGKPNEIIMGTDIHSAAIESARRNARTMGFAQADFFALRVEDFLKTRKLERDDLVFINPSRMGCSRAVLEAVADYRPGWICLVSCNPDTLSQDLAMLRSFQYQLEKMEAFDMFPFSGFLETVSLMRA